MTTTSRNTHKNVVALPSRRQPRHVAGSAILFSLSMVDLLLGGIGQMAQIILLILALGLLRPLLLAALRVRVCVGTVFAFQVVALFGIAVGARLSTTTVTAEFVVRLLFFGSLAILLGFVAATVPSFRSSLAAGIVIAGLVSATIVALGFTETSHHVEVGRATAVGLAVVPFLTGVTSKSLLLRIAAAGFMAATTFHTGARAPFVFAIVSILVVLTLGRASSASQSRDANRWRLAFAAVAVLIAGLLATGIVQLDRLAGGAGRQAEFLSARGVRDVQSLAIRIDDAYLPSIEAVQSNPLIGRGLPADVNEDIAYLYPHNFVLELGFGFGYPGVLLGIAIVLLGVRGVRRSLRTDPAMAAFIIYVLLNAQVSDDIVGNRMMMFAAAYGAFIVPSIERVRTVGSGER